LIDDGEPSAENSLHVCRRSFVSDCEWITGKPEIDPKVRVADNTSNIVLAIGKGTGSNKSRPQTGVRKTGVRYRKYRASY
jgi:hypothetical protein